MSQRMERRLTGGADTASSYVIPVCVPPLSIASRTAGRRNRFRVGCGLPVARPLG